LLPEVSAEENPGLFAGGNYVYGLPYPEGKSYVVWQGPGGSFSHNEPGSRYAVDFSLPLGSEVAAARSGTVIAVVQKNPDNKDGEIAPASWGNEVMVLHADGTMAVYAHLTTDGAKVSFGQTIRRGEVIGLSGNSGYSRGPHLHFAILGYEDGQCVSLPFDFLSADGTTITPREGLILLSEKNGVARIAQEESSPRRVVRKCYEKFDAETRYFAKTVEFLAVNKSDEVAGVELSFSRMENATCNVELPCKAALPADGKLHRLLSVQLVKLGETCVFSYVFRLVEPPGKEHIPLRTQREAGDGYVIEIRYFSDRIEFYAENKTSHAMEGSIDFLSLENVVAKEKMPRKVRLPADASGHYLGTLRIIDQTKGYSYTYSIGPGDGK
jgi:murein DD-endopeptidase MepM/ murein hydrolase activator NlpD